MPDASPHESSRSLIPFPLKSKEDPVTHAPEATGTVIPFPLAASRLPSPFVVPDIIERCLAGLPILIKHLHLPAKLGDEIQQTIESTCNVEKGADPAEAALLAGLLRASPEVKRLSDWALTLRVPQGVFPLHAATFALLGAVYFHAKLVSSDAAFASRVMEQYGGPPTTEPEVKEGFERTLRGLSKDETVPLGFLVHRCIASDTNASQTHLLGGVLAPLFTLISSEERSPKRSRFMAFVERAFGDPVPRHLSGLGILERISPRHVAALQPLAETYRRMTREEADSRRAQERSATEQEQALKEEKERRRAMEVEYLGTNAALERTLVRSDASGGIHEVDRAAVLSASYDIIKDVKEVSDTALYLVLDHLPRDTAVFAPNVLRTVNDKINHRLQKAGQKGWSTGGDDNLALAVLWETLSRVVVVTDPQRFGGLTKTILKFIDDFRAASPDQVFKEGFLIDLKRTFLDLYESKCRDHLP